MNVLQQALEALNDASMTISKMQQRQPHVHYSNEALYGKINAASKALRDEIAKQAEKAGDESSGD